MNFENQKIRFVLGSVVVGLLLALVSIPVFAQSGRSTSHEHNKVSKEDLAKRHAAVQGNTTISTGTQGGIGPVRLGMGQDSVLQILGQPDYTAAGDYTSTWNYVDIGISIHFKDHTAAPYVWSVTAVAFDHKSRTLGQTYWKDLEQPVVNWTTERGVGLGSTSFDTVRAYPEQADMNTQFSLEFDSGLGFMFTVDHRVSSIWVKLP